MRNTSGKSDTWQTPTLVVACGGIGGLLSWVYANTLGDPFPGSGFVALLQAGLLGMFAGFVGVYVLANSDTRALMRTLGVALLCGFCWKPVLDAGRAFVLAQVQEGDAEQAADQLRDQLEQLKEATNEELEFSISSVTRTTEEILRLENRIRDRGVRAQLEEVVSESVLALGDVAERAPEASARALGGIGAAAAVAEHPEITGLAVRSLASLPERTDGRPAVTAEASNSLLRIADAEEIRDRTTESIELRRMGVEMFRSAEQQFRERRDERSLRELRERSIIPKRGVAPDDS